MPLFLPILLLICSTLISANELSRLLERNRGFVVKMDDDDYPWVAGVLRKYDCHSIHSSSGPCTTVVGSGIEQYIDMEPAHAPKGARYSTKQPADRSRSTTRHVEQKTANFASNLLVTALYRQYTHQSMLRGLADDAQYASNAQSGRLSTSESLSEHNTDSSSLIVDQFQGAALMRQDKETAQMQQTQLYEDKHDSLAHVILKRRQRFSNQHYPNDPISAQKPSHSSTYLAKLLGNFEKLQRQQQKQEHFIPRTASGSAIPGTAQQQGAAHAPQITATIASDGTMTISSSLGSATSDVDQLAKLTDQDIEIQLSQLDSQLRTQLGQFGLDEDALDDVINQALTAFEANLKKQRADAIQIMDMRSTLQSGTTNQQQQQQQQQNQNQNPPSQSTSSTSTQSQQQKPQQLNTQTVEITPEEYAQLLDPETGDYDMERLQAFLAQHDIQLDAEDVVSPDLLELYNEFFDEEGRLNRWDGDETRQWSEEERTKLMERLQKEIEAEQKKVEIIERLTQEMRAKEEEESSP